MSPPGKDPVDPHARHPKLSLAWKIVTISFGVSLVLLGIAGLFLPILQGWLMILGGLAVLSPHSRKARWILDTLRDKLGIHKKKAGGGDGATVAADAEADRNMKTGS